MKPIEIGDRVRIDIPDKSDPDYRFHGLHGDIEAIIEDDASVLTGDGRDSKLYRVRLDTGDSVDLRRRDIRPPIED